MKIGFFSAPEKNFCFCFRNLVKSRSTSHDSERFLSDLSPPTKAVTVLPDLATLLMIMKIQAPMRQYFEIYAYDYDGEHDSDVGFAEKLKPVKL